MVSLKKSLASIALFSALSMHSGASPKYYDSPGGLHERYLNQHFAERFSDRNLLLFHSTIDKREKKHYFETLQPFEGSADAMLTVEIESYNIKTILELKGKKTEILTSQEKKLKGLLDELDIIRKKTPDGDRFLALMYNRINGKLAQGQSELEYVTILSMLDGKAGDCSVVSAAHSAVYVSYGFESSIKFGRARNVVNNDSTIHAWLEVKLSSGTMELDPTWYRTFVPLEPRGEKAFVKDADKKDDGGK